MDQQYNEPWTIKQSAELYGIERWSNDYFGVSEHGRVTAKTLNTEVELMDMVEGMIERDLQMPVLLRIENILDAQIFRLNDAFHRAIKNLGYQGEYRGVYPIKVNQQAQVVEEIADFGARYKHGFEVGSKPEIIIAIATLEEPGSLIICNGYKDQEFIELGLNAIKLGFECVFVVETTTEIPIIIESSRRLGIEPIIGVRIKTTAKVSGHWNSTSGDRSVFGLTSTQLIDLVDTLKQENMLHCLQLLHCHLGSQIPNIQDIRSGITETCRFYVDLIKEGAALKYIDLGGGLAVDYTGWASNDGQSRNYSLSEYCEDIVDALMETLDVYDIAHPTIVTESGRATIAYSSILIFNILDTTTFEPTGLPAAHEDEHTLITSLREIYSNLQPARVQECYNDAHYYRDEVRELFKRGQLDLRTRSAAENMFLDILHKIADLTETMTRVPQDLEGLKLSLADIYYGNFSLFQSLPDSWAIDQLFPIVPLHRLNEKPGRQAVLADITCDCDGKIDSFVGEEDISTTLPLHVLKEGEEYYLGVFLVGAYQETLGDLHNLFGDTNVVSVRINRDGSYEFVKEIHGDTIADVLSYVEYNPSEMQKRYRNTAERAVREGRITARERQQIIKAFNDSMQGYTYYEKDD
ncbi:MAG: biosynthetic arginine decarboxylase [Pseudomonadales bacterium]|nr:biosynthetic arginine decarboxylase [Pseudomonadales bacterium]